MFKAGSHFCLELYIFFVLFDLCCSWERYVLRPEVISGKFLNMTEKKIKLKLPSFEVKYQADLTEVMDKLGLDLSGDFSGISRKNIQVGRILTKTFLKYGQRHIQQMPILTQSVAPPALLCHKESAQGTY